MNSPIYSKEHEAAKDYFNRIAITYSSRYRESAHYKERYHVWKRLIDKYISSHLDSSSICIDMGCGDGLLSRIVASRSIKLVGMDQSEDMISLSRKHAEEEQLDEHTEYINATLPLTKELEEKYERSIDMITCSSVLEFIEDYKLTLWQFDKLLKPGGILLISLPNSLSIYRFIERIFKIIPISKFSYLKYQKHQFNPYRVKEMFIELNYKVLEEKFLGLPLQKYSSRIFGNYRPKWLATMFLIALEKRAL